MNFKKIVVLMGGPSSEAEISRLTGTAILNALQEKGYNAVGMEFVPKTLVEDIKEGWGIRRRLFRSIGKRKKSW